MWLRHETSLQKLHRVGAKIMTKARNRREGVGWVILVGSFSGGTGLAYKRWRRAWGMGLGARAGISQDR
jgi:hypothetical protein